MFRCNQCSKSFDDRLDLKRHLSIKHFNYSPYLCNICKKQLTYTATKQDMDRHFETVHPGTEQSIILSRDKEIEAKIKSALEKCQLPTTQNISLEFKNDSAYSAMCDLSPFGVNAAESGSISSHVRQEQNNGEMTQNEAIDDIEIVFESLPHKVKDEFESPKGISLGFKNALRQVYNVLCDETTIETSAMESESSSSQTNQDVDNNEEGERSSSEMKQELSNNEATENITADKNDVYQRKMIVQRESNVNLLETASESHTENEERDCPTTLATESNSCANDAPIFAFPETQSFHGSPTMSSATQSHSRLKSVVVLDERDAIEPAIQTPMQSSSNNPVAKLPRKRTFTKNDRHCRTKASAKRSNPKKTNGTEKVHKCNQCTYTCVRKSDVLRHMRTHTGHKPYKCDKCSYCNFASARNKDLKEHMRTHTGEKPFKCSFCAFASARISALKCHVRTHTGHKPYKCSECSYAGISSSQLQSHVRSNHSEEKK
ncbi:c2H2-type zinc-finger domain-containing protein [Ditylenchus destructor]|nr:c2H2-type zinc-finger domain-containing protein [Ditylenchus destructor]